MAQFKWGSKSLARLDSCHFELRRLCHHLISVSPHDLTVVWGWRNEEEQNAMFLSKASKKQWPDSKHNHTDGEGHPMSLAIDLAPYINNTIPWNSNGQFYYMSGWVMAEAKLLEIPLRWGGDWDSDGNIGDQTFNDLGHFELVDI